MRAAGDSRGGSKQAMELLQLMENKSGLTPGVGHYCAAMNVCGKEGDWTTAVHIFQQVQLQGVRPHTSCWNALLDALGRAKQLDQMLATYREMLASGQSGVAEEIWREMRQRRMTPGVKSYGALVNCYAVAGEPEKAEAKLAEMRQSTTTAPDAIMYCSLMKAYFSNGRLDEAVLIIDRMRASGVQPTFDTWTTVINAIDAHGKVNTADDLYADALSSGTINPYRPWRSNVIRLASGKDKVMGR
ncbi:hypothetical protein JKP88DRAFT_346546 [Tribonema minus]|uniref:PROP1-like PPR domain-containing protein n=1 Tax=Tribonema minus TaxID=303371 RepID=A0A835YY11_9STRA|nr:hypothetical protein JKP88DRAFT_346546 [Tribonema minus]